MALFAHCASLTVNAVKQPWENKPQAHVTANRLASALGLDMSQHWTPTVRSYLGRVTKAHILAAVRDAVGDEAAERIAGMKKQAMAEAAEQLLAETEVAATPAHRAASVDSHRDGGAGGRTGSRQYGRRWHGCRRRCLLRSCGVKGWPEP